MIMQSLEETGRGAVTCSERGGASTQVVGVFHQSSEGQTSPHRPCRSRSLGDYLDGSVPHCPCHGSLTYR